MNVMCLDNDVFEERKGYSIYGDLLTIEGFKVSSDLKEEDWRGRIIPVKGRTIDWNWILILGHGPSATEENIRNAVEKYNPKIIISCHDNCNCPKEYWDRLIVATCEDHEGEKADLRKWREIYEGRIVHLISDHIQAWTDMSVEHQIVAAMSKFYSGLGCVYYAILMDYRNIASLGLDWSYCNKCQLDKVGATFEYYDIRFPELNYNEIIPSSLKTDPDALNFTKLCKI